MRWLFWVLFTLAPVTALAQVPTARSLFDDGIAHYQRGAYDEAAEAFEASYALRQAPSVLFNIARSWEKAGKTAKAINAWQGWLAVSPTSSQRPDAEAALRALSDRLVKQGLQALTVTSLPVNARVTIDGLFRGTTPLTVELPPMRHLVRLDLEGREPLEQTIDFTLDAPRVESFELPPLGSPRAAMLQPAPLMPFVAPLPPPTVPTGPERLGDGVVDVHIEADTTEVRLYRANGNPNGECRAPCDRPIARPDEKFYVAGDNVTPSTPFVLADHSRRGRVLLGVKAGNSAVGIGLGTTLTSLGVAGTIAGLVFLISPSTPDKTGPAVGATLGIGALLGGLAAFLLNATTVTFNDEVSPAGDSRR
ncbi:MAG: PEGA domain-containing protein [Myxococcaceae bacterium]|nr:PEGA domain-containing protein [Myxococcaceae bacterium]